MSPSPILTTVAGVFCARAREEENNRGKTNEILTSKFFKEIFAYFWSGC